MIAPIEDRIVQRAILDVMLDSEELSGVREVASTSTSIGGIKGRGVENAISIIQAAFESGNANFVAGSDISGFFNRIDKPTVVNFLSKETSDKAFVRLFSAALDVDLKNAPELIARGEMDLFPTDEHGVAQGCPLSAFAGNIALKSFDEKMNGDGITCIRYIDDFILLGRKKAAVAKAMASAKEHLDRLEMSIYDPHSRPDKAFSGSIQEAHDFLGYRLIPGLYPPSEKNREKLLKSIDTEFEIGRQHILRALNGNP